MSRYLTPSKGLQVNGEGVVWFTLEGMELLESMIQEYAKKKKAKAGKVS